MLVLLTNVLEVKHPVAWVVLELFVLEQRVDARDVPVLLVEAPNIEVLLLEVLVAGLLEKLALVRDVCAGAVD